MPSTAPVDTFVESLAALDDAELVAFLSQRPDVWEHGPETFAELAARASEPRSLRACYDRLDAGARQLVQAACIRSAARLSDLAAHLGIEESSGRVHYAALARLGLVALSGAGDAIVFANPGLASLFPHPAGLNRPLAVLLAATPMRALREVAERLGVPARAQKNALLDDLAATLSVPARVRALIEAGPTGTVELASRLAAVGELSSAGYFGFEQLRSDDTPLGYLFRRGCATSAGYRTAMPAEVAIALRGGRIFPDLALDPPSLVTSATTRGDEVALEAASRLVTEAAEIAESFAALPAKCLKSGGLGVREVRRVAKAHGRSERDAARLIELAAGVGLIWPEESGECVLATSHYDEWAALATARRWTRLAITWRRAPIAFSVAGANDEQGKTVPPIPPQPDTLAPERRSCLLGVLAGLAPGEAADPMSVIGRALWQAPGLFAGGPATPETLCHWILQEAELLGVLAEGRLSAFGRAVAMEDEAGAEAALAAALPPIVREVTIQADLTAIAAGELEPARRAELEVLAELESHGGAQVYRFSEASLSRAFDAGRRGPEILSFLAALSPRGVPQALGYLIEDLDRRYGRLRVGGGRSFLRSEDPALITEICGARRLRAAGLRALAPTVALSSQAPDQLIVTLRAAGYLAALEDETGTLALRRPERRRAEGSIFDAPSWQRRFGRWDEPAGPAMRRALVTAALDDVEDDERFAGECPPELARLAAELDDGEAFELLQAVGLPTAAAASLLARLRDARPGAHSARPRALEDPHELVARLRAAPLVAPASSARRSPPRSRRDDHQLALLEAIVADEGVGDEGVGDE